MTVDGGAIARNAILDSDGSAIDLYGSDVVVSGNVVNGNGNGNGIRVLSGTGHALTRIALVGNGVGIDVGSGTTATVTGNDLYGNFGTSLAHGGNVGLIATGNFWGSAAGPTGSGDVQNYAGGTTVTAGFLTGEAKVLAKSQR